MIGTNTTGHAITRTDLANFLVDQLEADDHLGRAVTCSELVKRSHPS